VDADALAFADRRSLPSWLADSLTQMNGVCGFLAIEVIAHVLTTQQPGTVAMWLIISGALLDGIDGPVARRCISSGLGIELDRVADAVTFGVAPALVVSSEVHGGGLVLAAAAGYVAALTLRLAREQRAGPRDHFSGATSTLSAVGIVSIALLHPAPLLACAGILSVAAAAISPVPYPAHSRANALALAVWAASGFAALAGLLPLAPVAGVSLAGVLVLLPGGEWLRQRRRRCS
jgi:phosphatidylserine synthase